MSRFIIPLLLTTAWTAAAQEEDRQERKTASQMVEETLSVMRGRAEAFDAPEVPRPPAGWAFG